MTLLPHELLVAAGSFALGLLVAGLIIATREFADRPDDGASVEPILLTDADFCPEDESEPIEPGEDLCHQCGLPESQHGSWR